MSTARKILLVFGVVYVLIGVLGFIPGITVAGPQPGQGLLLGIFAVNALHNVAHLLLGAAMIWGAMTAGMERAVSRTLAGVFVVLVLASFIAPILEALPLNLADTLLHLASALVFAAVGWGMTGRTAEHARA